jgi:hypothetical protein
VVFGNDRNGKWQMANGKWQMANGKASIFSIKRLILGQSFAGRTWVSKDGAWRGGAALFFHLKLSRVAGVYQARFYRFPPNRFP